jgi:hypothetical protein
VAFRHDQIFAFWPYGLLFATSTYISQPAYIPYKAKQQRTPLCTPLCIKEVSTQSLREGDHNLQGYNPEHPSGGGLKAIPNTLLGEALSPIKWLGAFKMIVKDHL